MTIEQEVTGAINNIIDRDIEGFPMFQMKF